MFETLSNGHFCLVCKEFADPKFGVNVQNAETQVGVQGHLCNQCYQSFLASGDNLGAFKFEKLKTWLSGWRKDPFRNV